MVADALHVVEVLATSTGGIGTHVHGLAAGLVERGITVTVAGPQATEDSFGFTSVGAAFEPVEIATRPRPRADLEAIRALRSLISALATGPPGRDSGTADLDHEAVPLVVHAHGLRPGWWRGWPPGRQFGCAGRGIVRSAREGYAAGVQAAARVTPRWL